MAHVLSYKKYGTGSRINLGYQCNEEDNMGHRGTIEKDYPVKRMGQFKRESQQQSTRIGCCFALWGIPGIQSHGPDQAWRYGLGQGHKTVVWTSSPPPPPSISSNGSWSPKRMSGGRRQWFSPSSDWRPEVDGLHDGLSPALACGQTSHRRLGGGSCSSSILHVI